MNRTSWLDRLFRLGLLLYPRDFRQQFGEEMREVFRQQCQRRQNRLHLIGELLLDNLRAAPFEHGRVFAQQGLSGRNTLVLLGMISLLAYGFFIYSLGGFARTYDTMKTMAADGSHQMSQLPLVMAVRASNQHRYERALRMLDSADRGERLTAALMFADNLSATPSHQRSPNPTLDANVTAVIDETLAASGDAMELQLAAVACFWQAGCQPERITQRLTTLDGNNVVSWLLHAEAWKLASAPEHAAEALLRATTAGSYQSAAEHPLRTWLKAAQRDPFQASWWHGDDQRLHDAAEVSLGAFIAYRHYSACIVDSPVPTACGQLARRWRHAADTAQERARWHAVLAKQNVAEADDARIALQRYRTGMGRLDIALWDGHLTLSDLMEKLERGSDLGTIAGTLPAIPSACPNNTICGPRDLPWHLRSPSEMARPWHPAN